MEISETRLDSRMTSPASYCSCQQTSQNRKKTQITIKGTTQNKRQTNVTQNPFDDS